MGRVGRLIAGLGAFGGGYVKGRQIARENEWEDEVRAQKRQEWADQKAIRDALSGTDNGNAALAMAASPTDLADVTGGTVPRSADIQAMQRVGTNFFSDPAAAKNAAEMENFATGADEPGSEAAKVEPTRAYNVASRGIFNNAADAIDAQQSTQADAGLASAQRGASKPVTEFSQYLERVAPRVMSKLVAQGKLDQAKHFSDFVRTERGQSYTDTWAGAMRSTVNGDFAGALPKIEKLYNASVPDGRTAKISALDGDRYRVDFIDDKTGAVVSSREDSAGNLSHLGVTALSPEKAATWFATRDAELERETIANRRLDRQAEINAARDTEREDRRDERLGQRLDANAAALERRLSADAERRAGGKGLTAAQERTNAEIDAARERIAGMDPAEIQRRSAKATNTGRENPDHDPSIARAAALAGRRKIGDDPDFDARSSEPSVGMAPSGKTGQATQRADVAKRFRADPAMNNHTLGKETPNGIEVLSKGKLIGYFR